MALTGRAAGPPLGPPGRIVPRLMELGERLARATRGMGREVEVDPLALVGERAALAGLTRAGDTSCGGATRLLPTVDDRWIAVALARPDDWGLVPAWLEEVVGGPAVDWAAVAGRVAARRAGELVDRARLVGLAVAPLPATVPLGRPSGTGPFAGLPLVASRLAEGARPSAGCTVVDLSSLWAGPLCTQLLGQSGARVIKVESTRRPDGARLGSVEFFELLNGGKEQVGLDLATGEGVAALRELIHGADVVVEASRPRALEQLGIDAAAMLLAGRGPAVWLSITGYGRLAPGRDWVAFGDDAAVAGGLVAMDEHGPCFCADAVADPATGMLAAGAVAAALAAGGRWLLDVRLSDTAAFLAGDPGDPIGMTPPGPPELVAAPPRARPLQRGG